jgi:hypothetical protein
MYNRLVQFIRSVAVRDAVAAAVFRSPALASGLEWCGSWSHTHQKKDDLRLEV